MGGTDARAVRNPPAPPPVSCFGCICVNGRPLCRWKGMCVMKSALASLAALLLCTSFASANITVSGTGKITYFPDVGYITVGVSTEDKTAAEAWNKNGE